MEKRSKAEWAAILEAQEKAGESASRFCNEQGISYKQFLYRRRVFKKSHRPAMTTASSRSVMVSGGFIPIHVNEGASIRLRFPMGLVLESDRVPSAAWVVEVARRWAGGEDFLC